MLHWKSIAFTYRAVHLARGEQLQDAHSAVNPLRQVPALDIDGNILVESQAIAEYLEETRPEHPLLPTDALQRARVREIVCAIADGIQPLGNLKVLKQVAALVGGDADAHSATMGAWSRSVMNDGFRGLEALLERSAGAHAVGNEITLADVFIVPQVFNAARWKVDMSPFPTITRIADAAMQLPAFKAAAPAAQPDAE